MKKTCVACGTDKDITTDHIIPRSKGGNDSPENLQDLCLQCNASKGDRIVDVKSNKFQYSLSLRCPDCRSLRILTRIDKSRWCRRCGHDWKKGGKKG